MTDTHRANIYDYPKYYDLIFGSDWQAEYAFLSACFQIYAAGPIRRVFEPACGTGRLLYRFAKAGYRVSGVDLNERAVAFCNARLEKHGYSAGALVADMCDFTLPRPVDAAFNTINSFRHLLTEKQATAHLRCMARAVRPGGLYVLGFHLTPTSGPLTDAESWSAQRGHLCVNTQMQTTHRDLECREERCRMTFDIYTPTEYKRLEDEIIFRTYTAPQMKRLMKRVPEWQLVAVHDFSYNTRKTVPIDAQTEDIVLILRRKSGD